MGMRKALLKGDGPVDMRSARSIGPVLDGWTRRTLLALFLAGALLLCHDVYGVSHQVFATQHAEQPQHSHVPQADHADAHGVGGGEHPTQHQGGYPGVISDTLSTLRHSWRYR